VLAQEQRFFAYGSERHNTGSLVLFRADIIRPYAIGVEYKFSIKYRKIKKALV
jgi:hypothetical protein